MKIIGPELQRAADCEAVLRPLPRWFGIEPALLMYARDLATMPTFAVEDEAGTLWDARNPAWQCIKPIRP